MQRPAIKSQRLIHSTWRYFAGGATNLLYRQHRQPPRRQTQKKQGPPLGDGDHGDHWKIRDTRNSLETKTAPKARRCWSTRRRAGVQNVKAIEVFP